MRRVAPGSNAGQPASAFGKPDFSVPHVFPTWRAPWDLGSGAARPPTPTHRQALNNHPQDAVGQRPEGAGASKHPVTEKSSLGTRSAPSDLREDESTRLEPTISSLDSSVPHTAASYPRQPAQDSPALDRHPSSSPDQLDERRSRDAHGQSEDATLQRNEPAHDSRGSTERREAETGNVQSPRSTPQVHVVGKPNPGFEDAGTGPRCSGAPETRQEDEEDEEELQEIVRFLEEDWLADTNPKDPAQPEHSGDA